MINYDDPETVFSLRDLISLKESKKPIVLWVGAGASSWKGYPSWHELAENLFQEFKKKEHAFDIQKARELIDTNKYPDFFELCSEVNEKRYYKKIANELKPREDSLVYERFSKLLMRLDPAFVITTNADNSLETNLKKCQIVLNSDFERAIDYMQEGVSFIAKLHGCLSSLGSLVFRSQDYDNLIKDKNYLNLINFIFMNCSVVFLGTSLSDIYILESLVESENTKKFFGTGPHFLLSSKRNEKLPSNIKQLLYKTSSHADHRSSLLILEELSTPTRPVVEPLKSVNRLKSIHVISDLLAPGSWRSSLSLVLDSKHEVFLGTGFINSELENYMPTMFDDLVVGLICFDEVYCPLNSASKIFATLGEVLMGELIDNGGLKFVYLEENVGIAYPQKKQVSGGEIVNISPQGTLEEQIRRIISRTFTPQPGREVESTRFSEKIINATTPIAAKKEIPTADITKGMLVKPSIREIIGMSDGVSLTSIPSYLKFPVLRLAHAMEYGLIANFLEASSLKLEFGIQTLAAPIFKKEKGSESINEITNYVVKGQFSTTIGEQIIRDPKEIMSAIEFRHTAQGESLRKEIHERILSNHTLDFVSCIAGGLNTVIPKSTLQEARNKFHEINMQKTSSVINPVVWSNGDSENALEKWRKRSLNELLSIQKHHFAPCPCGSGDKMKDCCLYALTK